MSNSSLPCWCGQLAAVIDPPHLGIAFRHRFCLEQELTLIEHVSEDGLAAGINPFDHGSGTYTDVMKTQALKDALTHHGFDAAFGGARRNEEKSRAKERGREYPGLMNLLRPNERDVTVNGLKLRVLDWGGASRSHLLLLHGFTGHAHAWDTLAIALQPHFHVWALDQRGHGDSDPADVYGPVAAFGDISGVVDQLGLTPLMLVGLSMGGRNGMYFAAKRPDAVRKLVVVDIGPEISKKAMQPSSGPPEPETWESIEQAARHLFRSNPHPGIHYYRWVVSSSLKARPDGRLVWKWHPSIKERRPGDFDWWSLLPSIRTETLVLRGAESMVLDHDVAERMVKTLPRARLVEIPRAVHTLHEDNPEAVLDALRDFLAF